MNPWVMMGILSAAFGGAMFLKSELIDKPKYEQNKKTQALLSAKTEELHPYTGKQSESFKEKEPDSFGSLLQGGFAGAQLGQNIHQAYTDDKMAESQMELNKAKIASINRGGTWDDVDNYKYKRTSLKNPALNEYDFSRGY